MFKDSRRRRSEPREAGSSIAQLSMLPLSGGSALTTNCGLALLGLLMIELTRTGVHEYTHFTHGWSETIFGQLMLYLGSISILARGSVNKWTLPVILLVGLLIRLVALAAPPFLSTDIYRYVWDGMVQRSGINPFRYIPADPHLAFLRDLQIYPHINRRDYAHTIYPPGSQMLFLFVAVVHASMISMKFAMLTFETATCVFLLRCLRMLSLPREQVLLYAWHPLCVWEIGSSGHVDAAALTMITVAIFTSLRGKTSQAASWLAAATLIKLYPITLLPALLRRSSTRHLSLPLIPFLAIVAGGYLPYLSVGRSVLGFLPNYAQEEGISSGSRYFPLMFVNRTLHLNFSPPVYLATCAILLAALGWWAYSRADQATAFVSSGLILATALNLCFSPHYPWYFLWLLPFLTLWPWRPAFYIVMAATYLLATRLGAPGEGIYRMNTLLYGGFFLLLALELTSLYGFSQSRFKAVKFGPARAAADTPLLPSKNELSDTSRHL